MPTPVPASPPTDCNNTSDDSAPEGTTCNPTDACDGSGGCPAKIASVGLGCADGLFCNGADSCIDGLCEHSGNPCMETTDADGDCSETCDETAGDTVALACTANDTTAHVCNDGQSCSSNDRCVVSGAQAGTCAGTPGIETCNGVDDDCDGTADNGVLNACGGCGALSNTPGTACDGTDTDLCTEGTWICNQTNTAVTCNDNNSEHDLDTCGGGDQDCDLASADGTEEAGWNSACDGSTDSDLCLEGTMSVCSGTTLTCSDPNDVDPDVCDGQDNDCTSTTLDGSADPQLGVACDGADSDGCTDGRKVCSGGSLTCNDPTALGTGFENLGNACDSTDDSDLCYDGVWECAQAGNIYCHDSPGYGIGFEDYGTPCDHPTADTDSCEDGTWTCGNDGTLACDDTSANGAGFPADFGNACDNPNDSDTCKDGIITCDATGATICNDTSSNGSGFPSDFGQPCDGHFDPDTCNDGVISCAANGDVECRDNVSLGPGFTNFGQPCDSLTADPDSCTDGSWTCDGDGALACIDTAGNDNVTFFPNLGPEICDGIDNDCTSTTPEGSADLRLGDACDGTADADLCTDGARQCIGGTLTCADNSPNDNTASFPNLGPEVCDGNDNDCNPDTADGSGVPCSDGLGCTTDTCVSGECVGAPNDAACSTLAPELTAACTLVQCSLWADNDSGCVGTPITACGDGDGNGCCPTGCNANNDSDCTADCGNNVIESGEQCDFASPLPNDGCDDDTCQFETPFCAAATCAGADNRIEFGQSLGFGAHIHFRDLSAASEADRTAFETELQTSTDSICAEIMAGDFTTVTDNDETSEPTCHVYQMNEDGTRGPEVMSGPATTDTDVNVFVTTADPPLPPGTHLLIECTVTANGLTSAPCTRDIDVICTADSECADTDQCDGDETCDTASASPTFGQCIDNDDSDCDDENGCTDDSCDTATGDSETGCINANNTDACPDDGITCTGDVCSEGACTHPVTTESCLISGVCYADGDTELEQCRKCDAAANPASWTPLAPGTECRAAGTDSTCDPAERCGTSGQCPANVYANTTTDCGNSEDTECSNPDKCDGSGSCSPMHELVTVSCEDTTLDNCLDSKCDGSGACNQRAIGEGSAYICRAAGSDPACNPAELCVSSIDGTCPTDQNTVTCEDGDGCCPSGCNTSTTNGDNDCLAFCGNGITEARATPPEQCDDGDDDNADGCREDCTPSDCETGETQYCEIEDTNGPCRNGMQTCDSETGSWGDCVATFTVDPASPPPEICDGIDNDCNGGIDDNVTVDPDSNTCDTEACEIMSSVDMTEAILYLSFDNTIYDSSGSANVITSTGSISYEAGRVGPNAVVFDGASHIAVSPDDRFIFSPRMIISLWIKIPEGGTGDLRSIMHIIGTNPAEMDTIPHFTLSMAENSLTFRQVVSDSAEETYLGIDVRPLIGSWNHLAVVNDGAIAKLYLNGEEIATDDSPAPATFEFENPEILVGAMRSTPDGSPRGNLVGSIDDLIILPPNFSEDAIRVLANAGIAHTNVADGTTCNDGDLDECDECQAGVCVGESVDTDEDGVNECDDDCAEHDDTADVDDDDVPDGCDTETCDGVDNDGDSQIDEDFAEALADPCEFGTGICKVLTQKVCKEDGTGVAGCPEAPPSWTTDGSTACNNVHFCDGEEICAAGACVTREGSVPSCADDNVCTDDACDEVHDRCQNTPIAACCNRDAECPPTTEKCKANRCDGTTNRCALVAVEGCCTEDSECDDRDGCTSDACLENNTCTHVRVAPENIDYDSACEMVDCNEATGFEWKAVPNPAKKDEVACNLCPEGKKPIEVFGVLTSTDKGEKVEFFAVDDPKILVASFAGTDLGNFLNIGEFDQILVFTDGRHLFSLEYSLESRRLTMTLRYSFDAAVVDLEKGDDKGDTLFAATTDDRFFKIATKDYAVTELKGGLKLAHLAFNSFDKELIALDNKGDILSATLPADGAKASTEISLKPLVAKPTTTLVKRTRWTQMKTAGDGRLFLTLSGSPSIQIFDAALASLDPKEAVYKTLTRLELENDKSVINDLTTRKGFLFVAGGDNAIYKIAEDDLLKEKDPDAKEEVLSKITPDKKIADGKTPLIFAVDACKDDPRCVATPEVCDGIDNDCDGSVDADDSDVVRPELGFELVGVCADLQMVCLGKKGWDFPAPSQWAEILGEDVYTKDEDGDWCDDEDNDCDGTTDEECLCEEGAELGCPGKWRNAELKAPCQLGTQKCLNGRWGECEGFVLPEKEITDGIDNDCDGSIDEGCCQTCCVNVCCYCSVLPKWDHAPLPEFAPDYTAIDLPEEKPLVDVEALVVDEAGEVAETTTPPAPEPQLVPEAECNEEGQKWTPADVWGAVKDGHGNLSHVQLGKCGPVGGLEAGGGGFFCGISRNSGGGSNSNLLFPILILSLIILIVRRNSNRTT